MTHEHNDAIFHDHNDDGVDRRGFLKCMAWAGTGAVWWRRAASLEGLTPWAARGASAPKPSRRPHLRPDQRQPHRLQQGRRTTTSSRRSARRSTAINALPKPPAFMLHTGDITHLSKPEEFDTVAADAEAAPTKRRVLRARRTRRARRRRQEYLERFGKGTRGQGWYSFDHDRRAFRRARERARPQGRRPGHARRRAARLAREGSQARLGAARRSSCSRTCRCGRCIRNGAGARTTARGAGLLKRFGSVTVLNGHIHQVMQKVEGNVTFHTARVDRLPAAGAGHGAPRRAR